MDVQTHTQQCLEEGTMLEEGGGGGWGWLGVGRGGRVGFGWGGGGRVYHAARRGRAWL